jgi:capsular polysaccharide biosynthesis protein
MIEDYLVVSSIAFLIGLSLGYGLGLFVDKIDKRIKDGR